MSSSAKVCPQCGKSAGEEPAEDEGTEPETLDDELDLIEKSLVEKEPESLFMCPSCGAFMSVSASKCPQCGTVVEEDAGQTPEEAHAGLAAVETAIPGAAAAREDDKQVLALCVACGAFSPEGKERCPSCNALMSPAAEEQKGALPKEDVELLEMLVSAEPKAADMPRRVAARATSGRPGMPVQYGVAICGVCGAFVKPDTERCNVCSTLLTETTILYPETSEVVPEVQSFTGNATGVLKGVLGVEGSPENLPQSPDIESNIAVCTLCGAFMSKDAAKCSICNTLRSEMPEYTTLNVPQHDEPAMRALVVCPRCGGFAREGEQACDKCGSALPEKLERVESRDHDGMSEAEAVLVNLLGATDLIDTMPTEPDGSELDICSKCGAFVSSKSTQCPMCGSGTAGEIENIMGMLKAETVATPGETVPECPFCGATVAAHSTKCDECGFVFAPDISEEKADAEMGALESELETLDFMAEGMLGSDLGVSRAKSSDPIVTHPAGEDETDRELGLLELEPKQRPKGDILGGKPVSEDSDALAKSEIDEIERMLVLDGAGDVPAEAAGEPQPSTGIGGFELALAEEPVPETRDGAGGDLDEIGQEPTAIQPGEKELADAIDEIESAMLELPDDGESPDRLVHLPP